jgi:hypothetical protein
MSLSDSRKDDAKRAVELLLILILLCHYEVRITKYDSMQLF